MDAAIAARLDEKKHDPVLRYEEYAYYQFSIDGEGVSLRESRQHLAGTGMDSALIHSLDEIVIEAAIANDYINPDLVKDDEAQPLQNWWWHLGKIRAKTYPVDLLPAHLQAVYREAVE